MNGMARGGSARLSYRQRAAMFRGSGQFLANAQARRDSRFFDYHRNQFGPGNSSLDFSRKASHIGVDKLAKANKRGRNKFANGGLVGNNNVVLNPDILQAFNKFDSSVAKLTVAIESMPHTISMNVRHTMEVVFNGAEVLATLQPSLQDLVIKTTESQINRMIRDKFPDVGTMQ
jgi:hypothetical protein